jgi:hypothetical protein
MTLLRVFSHTRALRASLEGREVRPGLDDAVRGMRDEFPASRANGKGNSATFSDPPVPANRHATVPPRNGTPSSPVSDPPSVPLLLTARKGVESFHESIEAYLNATTSQNLRHHAAGSGLCNRGAARTLSASTWPRSKRASFLLERAWLTRLPETTTRVGVRESSMKEIETVAAADPSVFQPTATKHRSSAPHWMISV